MRMMEKQEMSMGQATNIFCHINAGNNNKHDNRSQHSLRTHLVLRTMLSMHFSCNPEIPQGVCFTGKNTEKQRSKKPFWALDLVTVEAKTDLDNLISNSSQNCSLILLPLLCFSSELHMIHSFEHFPSGYCKLYNSIHQWIFNAK